jgi:hypothetical protein
MLPVMTVKATNAVVDRPVQISEASLSDAEWLMPLSADAAPSSLPMQMQPEMRRRSSHRCR